MDRHYLVVSRANGDEDDEEIWAYAGIYSDPVAPSLMSWRWDVVHPPECEDEVVDFNPLSGDWWEVVSVYNCEIEHEIREGGKDAFDAAMWYRMKPPFEVPIVIRCEVSPSTPDSPEEYEAWIEMDEVDAEAIETPIVLRCERCGWILHRYRGLRLCSECEVDTGGEYVQALRST